MSQLKVPVSPLDHIRGPNDAMVTLVEYGDYECPHCAGAQPFVKQCLDRFSENLRFVYRHFPLVEVHPHAGTAAETAEFAGSQNAFWQMHEAIFAHQQYLDVPLLISLAAKVGLSAIALRDALASHRYAPKVGADFLGGVRSGVNGTPTFFINGTRYDSPYGAASLTFAIDEAIVSAAA